MRFPTGAPHPRPFYLPGMEPIPPAPLPSLNDALENILERMEATNSALRELVAFLQDAAGSNDR